MFPWLRRLRSGGSTARRTPGHGAPRRVDGAPDTPARGQRAPGTPEEKRFSQVYAEDRVGPMPYPNQASPDVAAARGRVRALVNDLLPNAVDEGTGAALDPLIASWASGWLARVDSEHADHHAVVDRLIGGARRQLADAEANHERDRRALEIARRDYADARDRLAEAPVAGSAAGSTGDTPPEAATAAGSADPADLTEPADPRRGAARGPRAARQALSVRRAAGPDRPDEPRTGPVRVRASAVDPAVDPAVTEQETR